VRWVEDGRQGAGARRCSGPLGQIIETRIEAGLVRTPGRRGLVESGNEERLERGGSHRCRRAECGRFLEHGGNQGRAFVDRGRPILEEQLAEAMAKASWPAEAPL